MFVKRGTISGILPKSKTLMRRPGLSLYSGTTAIQTSVNFQLNKVSSGAAISTYRLILQEPRLSLAALKIRNRRLEQVLLLTLLTPKMRVSNSCRLQDGGDLSVPCLTRPVLCPCCCLQCVVSMHIIRGLTHFTLYVAVRVRNLSTD